MRKAELVGGPQDGRVVEIDEPLPAIKTPVHGTWPIWILLMEGPRGLLGVPCSTPRLKAGNVIGAAVYAHRPDTAIYDHEGWQ